MSEQWRTIDGWPDHEVSSEGAVRRARAGGGLRAGHELKQHERTGYRYVVFRPAVHRLVAVAFLGPQPVGCVVNHKDGDKTNNCAENLEWVTPSANGVHAYETGLQKRGEAHGRAKLTDREVAQIRARYTGAQGEQRTLATEYGVSQGLVSQIVRGDIWRHLPLGVICGADRQARGEHHARATVTAKTVRAIRRRFASGRLTHAQLAEKYGVSRTTVSRIVRGVIWKT